MKILMAVAIGVACWSCADLDGDFDTKRMLLEQLKNNHTTKDWYVPSGVALAQLTADQANWQDSTDNHSIGELVSHLAFWTERSLLAFQGDSLPDFTNNNEETFAQYDSIEWLLAVNKLDSIQTAWEVAVEQATEQQLNDWSSEIIDMCSHHAYHTGQIVYIRKKNGWWSEEQSVK